MGRVLTGGAEDCDIVRSIDESLWQQRHVGKRLAVGKSNELIKHLDEVIICFKDSPKGREYVEKLVTDAINYVTEKYMLRRKLGCDVQFGKRYSQIH